MNDSEIDRLMRLARPTPSAGFSPGAGELLEEIVSLSPSPPESSALMAESIEVAPHRYLPGPRRGRRILVAVGVVLVVVAAILTPVVLGAGDDGSSPANPPAPPATSPANPFLLMKTPGWKVDSVSLQEGGLSGEVLFDGPDRAQLGVDWGRIDDEEAYRKVVASFEKLLDTTMLGEPASLYRIPGPKPFTYALIPKPGGTPISFVGGGTDLASFQQQVRGLVAVTPSQWYAAMGDQVATTGNLSAVLTRVLAGVPLPKGFDTTKYTSDLPVDYGSLGETLTGAVVCDWMDTYRRAWSTQDEPGMAAADQALKGATGWPVLRQERPDKLPGWVDGLSPYLTKMAARKDLADAMGNFYCPV